MKYHRRLVKLLDPLVKVGFRCDLQYENMTSKTAPYLGEIKAGITVPLDESGENHLKYQKELGVSICTIQFDPKKSIHISELGDLNQEKPRIYCQVPRKKLVILPFKYKSADTKRTYIFYENELQDLVESLREIAYEEQGYNTSIPVARKATCVFMLCVSQALPRDLVRLLGQYLYATRYEVDIWKINE